MRGAGEQGADSEEMGLSQRWLGQELGADLDRKPPAEAGEGTGGGDHCASLPLVTGAADSLHL